MSLILGMLAVTATCVPGANPTRPATDIVRDFTTAVKARDEAMVGSLIKPGALYRQGGNEVALATILTMLMGVPDLDVLEILDITDSPDGIRLHTRKDGREANSVLTFEGGCITGMTQVDA